ncbi:hypothetical protein GPL15_17160 [Clostridium sp. MCC353]|nr:hypothetical protein [Clostridium sp. MCC353]
MNLMLIIVQEEDAAALTSAFKRNKIQATKFDAEGLVSNRRLKLFLVGSDKTEEVLKLVEANCQERSIETEVLEYNGHMMVDVQKTIVIGGATVFILGLSQLIKIKGGVNVKY